MRFWIAAALFILSVIFMLVGLGQRTIWAPPPSTSASIQVDASAPYTVIPHSVIALNPGNPIIRASGTKNAFVSSGRESDVMAWVGSSKYQNLEIADGVLTFVEHPGDSVFAVPAGSDLWRDESSAVEKTQLRIKSSDEAAVLIASNGKLAAPGNIEIIWPIYHDLTWSNIFLISGASILLAALLFNWLTYRSIRRKSGPKRKTPKAPKPPQYRAKKRASLAPVRGRRSSRRAFVAIPASMVVLGLLAGCSAPTSEPSPSASADQIEVPPAVVTAKQLERILGSVSKASSLADEALDKKLLTSRFAGPALSLRAVNYYLRTKSSSVAATPAIVGEPITFSLPAASNTWPRTIMAVTDERGDAALPQMLILQQRSPRENYRVWFNVRLMPGAKIPEVPSADAGAIPVDPASVFLKIAPQSIPAAYGDVINRGASSLSAGLFDTSKDEFYKQVSESQKSQVATLTTAKITFTHALGDKNVQSLATTAGGALVAVYMTDTYTIKPIRRISAVAVTGQEKILLGADGSTTGVKSVYGDMLLFYVPALSDEQGIRLLGVTQGLLSVRSL